MERTKLSKELTLEQNKQNQTAFVVVGKICIMIAKQKTKLQQEVDEMIAYLTIWKINVAREKERLKK